MRRHAWASRSYTREETFIRVHTWYNHILIVCEDDQILVILQPAAVTTPVEAGVIHGDLDRTVITGFGPSVTGFFTSTEHCG